MINIVLYQPEIPFNTANIIRTCVGTNINLHIIEPCGFDLSKDHKDLKRGSTNFLDDVNLILHKDFVSFEEKINTEKLYILTRYGQSVYSDIEYNEDIHLKEDIYVMFGKESAGIPKEILDKYLENTFRIPMTKKMRSLNLSNCAALVAFDLVRKTGFYGLESLEPHRENFLERK